jgi:hypothetical protein
MYLARQLPHRLMGFGDQPEKTVARRNASFLHPPAKPRDVVEARIERVRNDSSSALGDVVACDHTPPDNKKPASTAKAKRA